MSYTGLKFGLQCTIVQGYPGETGYGHWSSLNGSERVGPELQMRLGSRVQNSSPLVAHRIGSSSGTERALRPAAFAYGCDNRLGDQHVAGSGGQPCDVVGHITRGQGILRHRRRALAAPAGVKAAPMRRHRPGVDGDNPDAVRGALGGQGFGEPGEPEL